MKGIQETQNGFRNNIKTDLRHDIESIRNRLNEFGLCRIDQQQELSQLFYEIEENLILINDIRKKITVYNLDNFNEKISIQDLHKFLHENEQSHLRICDIELFFGGTDSITKQFLANKLGSQYGESDEFNKSLMIRLLTSEIQLCTIVEIKRWKWQRIAFRIDELFFWLDVDGDGILTALDFSKRFGNLKYCYGFLTKSCHSFNESTFRQYFRPKSQAVYI